MALNSQPSCLGLSSAGHPCPAVSSSPAAVEEHLPNPAVSQGACFAAGLSSRALDERSWGRERPWEEPGQTEVSLYSVWGWPGQLPAWVPEHVAGTKHRVPACRHGPADDRQGGEKGPDRPTVLYSLTDPPAVAWFAFAASRRRASYSLLQPCLHGFLGQLVELQA